MNSNLMHSAGEWFTEDNTRLAVVAQLLERRRTFFALRRHFANTDFVAHHLDGLFTFDAAAAEERKIEH